METVSGSSNWKLIIRREQDGVTLVRAVTCDARAALPDTLFGLPVTALGNHALSPTAWAETGEEVLVTCGPLAAEPEWNNRNLRDLTLPAGLKRVGDCTFLNCGGLQTLRLHDCIEFWGGSSLTNCRALNTIYLTRTNGQGISLAHFAEEISRELDITVQDGDQVTRLIFPEYEESDEEDFIAQAIQFSYHISGAGYLHHHCFHQKKLTLKDYDDLWPGYLRMHHDNGCAVRLAWWRLRYPTELTEKAEAGYLAYLRAHTAEAAAWLLAEKDTPGLSFLLERTEPDRDTLSAACAAAREAGASEALALLLEEQHRRFPAGLDKTFDL